MRVPIMVVLQTLPGAITEQAGAQTSHSLPVTSFDSRQTLPERTRCAGKVDRRASRHLFGGR